MNDLSTLPSCIGYFGMPQPPNGPCEECKYAADCKRVVSKDRVKSLLTRIEKIEALLKGGVTVGVG